MLLFAGLVLCSATHLALEYAYKPSTMEGTNFQRFEKQYHGKRSLDISSECEPVAKNTLSPGLPHDFHLFLERDFRFEYSSFVVGRENNLFVQGIESPVDKITLASLFYGTLLCRHVPQTRASINVSCRDYFDDDQRESLIQICSNLGYRTRVIPESLASILEGAVYVGDGTSRRRYCLNFRGSQTVSSLYELKMDGSRVFASLIETKPVMMASDYDIERLVARAVADALEREGISFLPYFYNADLDCYADIQEEVMKVIDLLSSDLEEHLILEIPYYEKMTSRKVSAIIEKVIPLEALRQEVEAIYINKDCITKEYQCLVEEMPQDAELHILTDVSLRGRFMKEFALIPNEFIVKGLNQAHDSRIMLLDDRICNDYRPVQPAYSSVARELELKRDAKRTYNAIPLLIGKLRNLTDDEIGTMDEYLASEPRTLKTLREMALRWSSLVRLNSEREADSILRASRVKDLDDCLVDIRGFMESLEDSMGTDMQNALSETEVWLEKNREDMSLSKDFEARAIKLRSAKRYIEKKLAKAAEDSKRDAKKKASDGAASKVSDESMAADAPKDAGCSAENRDRENLVDDHGDKDVGETPAISKALEEMNREVL